jgi:Acetyl co-enzyme A carboxylase carboxyltransferase-like
MRGTGCGAALALMPAGRVICAQHGWLSPLSPEGASAILYRSTERALELAARQEVRSADLLRNGTPTPHPSAEPLGCDYVSEAASEERTCLSPSKSARSRSRA